MDGFYNKFLRVNLTQRKTTVEAIPDEVTARYLGGKGLGAYLLLKYAPPGVHPLAPENPLIIVTGPATDSGLAPASRYMVFAKSPQTGFFGEAASGGHTPPQIRATGYDAIILEGAAPAPIFLEISDKDVKYHDAGPYWGMDSYESEAALEATVGVKGAKAFVIGPAGENLVVFSGIHNDHGRHAARTGMGAVMGSKKIKGIVFHGKARCKLHDQEALKAFDKEFRKNSLQSGTAKFYRDLGTPGVVSMTNEVGAFPSYYWTKGTVPYWPQISGAALQEKYKPRSKACAMCFMACGKVTTISEGDYAGTHVEGPEYETIYTFGGLNAVDNLPAIAYLNELCDRLGMDTISAGNITALAIEASRLGRVNFKLEYGDTKSIAELLREMASRTGRGEILSKGIKEASKILGLDDIAVHVKGLEPAGYEPRALKGMGLAYAINERGADHLRATVYKPELAGVVDPQAIEGKAALVIDFEDRHTVSDTLIFCRFYRDLIGWNELPAIIHHLTGLELDRAGIEKMSLDIANLIREFNLREGMTPADDTLPPRLLNNALEDSGKRLTPAELQYMLDDYYTRRGWKR